MKKNTKNTNTTATTQNTNMEEIMKEAEVKVEVKSEVENTEEPKQKKVYRTFKEIILEKITKRAKNLPDYTIDPIIEQIGAALDELQTAMDSIKEQGKSERMIVRKLSKFSKEQIIAYLASLPKEN
jgi:lantibiotic modifying enzyme